ncbi:Dyp-type peroxidase domain-containing protein [Lentzea jiangxiensis]|uniref:Dyp-type peroxidase domain-containing protein n=1 Tax=Lentzea jiangxiensis TaxID=641025 RepID=UPI00115FDDDD
MYVARSGTCLREAGSASPGKRPLSDYGESAAFGDSPDVDPVAEVVAGRVRAGAGGWAPHDCGLWVGRCRPRVPPCARPARMQFSVRTASLHGQRLPAGLTQMSALPSDVLDEACCHGDLFVQICAATPERLGNSRTSSPRHPASDRAGASLGSAKTTASAR